MYGTEQGRHDPWGKTGLAHVFEHMMFKGTQKISGTKFSRIIQENGSQYNAFTSYDYAGYYATTSADQVSIIMELEADRMQHMVLSSEDFQSAQRTSFSWCISACGSYGLIGLGKF